MSDLTQARLDALFRTAPYVGHKQGEKVDQRRWELAVLAAHDAAIEAAGYVIVPTTLTAEMIVALTESIQQNRMAYEVWADTLAARPKVCK